MVETYLITFLPPVSTRGIENIRRPSRNFRGQNCLLGFYPIHHLLVDRARIPIFDRIFNLSVKHQYLYCTQMSVKMEQSNTTADKSRSIHPANGSSDDGGMRFYCLNETENCRFSDVKNKLTNPSWCPAGCLKAEKMSRGRVLEPIEQMKNHGFIQVEAPVTKIRIAGA